MSPKYLGPEGIVQLPLSAGRVQFQAASAESSDEDEILYFPNKMLENKDERFYIEYAKYKDRSMEIMWNRLSHIICNKRPKEFSKFMRKIEMMHKIITPK